MRSSSTGENCHADTVDEQDIWEERTIPRELTLWAPNATDWDKADVWYQLDVRVSQNENGAPRVFYGAEPLPA
jgi:hypothetical protein